jgi:hypothetical protein
MLKNKPQACGPEALAAPPREQRTQQAFDRQVGVIRKPNCCRERRPIIRHPLE